MSCFVLGQDTSLSECISPPKYINGYQRIQCWGKSYNGLASHPEGVEILLVASCYRNRNKLRPTGPLASNADLLFFYTTVKKYCELDPSLSSLV